jgi:hypothetical protein
METTKEQKIAKILQKQLDLSQAMWDEKEVSHAYIIGFLQMSIRVLIEELS